MAIIRHFLFLFFLLSSCGYHKPVIRTLPDADREPKRILFIAFDGIGYDFMAELKAEGHFKDWQDPIPLNVTFPSDTTIGFTGIFKPLRVGKVPGYETRFYSYRENKVIGGTPWEIYRIPINYKTYFDSFRHTMFEKGMMYTFPGVAGKEDLVRIRRLLSSSKKKILFAYVGATDGSQHMLGKKRAKRFMVFADRYLSKMKRDYERTHKEPLRIVMLSDHGFHYDSLRMIPPGKIGRALKKGGMELSPRLREKKDVVLVQYGLLSSGVMVTASGEEERAARLIRNVRGMDLVFWPDGNKIRMVDAKEGEAFFEYRWPLTYRYVPLKGDPLDLGRHRGWLSDTDWKNLTAHHRYPDPGYRLYEAFHNLVENKASVLFSLKPAYQFGAMSTHYATKFRLGGHKGTHGGLFRDVSQGVVMTDDFSMKLPQAIRYDDFFPRFLPRVTEAYRRQGKTEEVQVLVSH
ncbi:MAG: hypothetical protein Q7T11_01105 [Deltaproteobacteria bacterium]|nr:hypothetical protein [Deltaproteobacteria bacterium]